MEYLIYISSAVKLMDDAELANILKSSRANNTADNITGLLIYSEGTFIQVLEGNHPALRDAFNRISADTRHKNIIKLTEGNLTERNFPDWSMAFASVNQSAMQELAGYINPSIKNFMKTESSHAAITILKTFAENNRVTGD